LEIADVGVYTFLEIADFANFGDSGDVCFLDF